MKDVSVIYGVLSIVGVFLSIAVSIVAWFLKGIYDRLGTIEVAQATLIANDKHKEQDIEELKIQNRILFEEVNKIKGQL